jgi:hypothetical protein
MIERITECQDTREIGDIRGWFDEVTQISEEMGLKAPPIRLMNWTVPEDQAWIPLPQGRWTIDKAYAPVTWFYQVFDPTYFGGVGIAASRPAQFKDCGVNFTYDPFTEMDRSDARQKIISCLARWVRFLDGYPTRIDLNADAKDPPRGGRPKMDEAKIASRKTWITGWQENCGKEKKVAYCRRIGITVRQLNAALQHHRSTDRKRKG